MHNITVHCNARLVPLYLDPVLPQSNTLCYLQLISFFKGSTMPPELFACGRYLKHQPACFFINTCPISVTSICIILTADTRTVCTHTESCQMKTRSSLSRWVDSLTQASIIYLINITGFWNPIQTLVRCYFEICTYLDVTYFKTCCCLYLDMLVRPPLACSDMFNLTAWQCLWVGQSDRSSTLVQISTTQNI